jgi:Right handed beta helix region
MRASALLAALAALLALAAPATGDGRDDTAWLQARLDSGGGAIFLPSLPNGQCYATRGLWVTQDHTAITSDGACITAIGPGDVRLTSTDGDPIAADAVFYVNHGDKLLPTPDHVTISGLRIVVPQAAQMYGIGIYGHDVTVRNVTVTGSPIDDVTVGSRANGDGYASHVVVTGCRFDGAQRNVVSASSFIDLRIEQNTISGAAPGAGPSAGIDIEPDTRGGLALDLRIGGNVISGNAGPGVILSLRSNTGSSLNADRFSITGNKILGNGTAGVVVIGGQADGKGRAAFTGNTVRGNHGPGVMGRSMTMTLVTGGNAIGGNDGPAYQNVKRANSRL